MNIIMSFVRTEEVLVKNEKDRNWTLLKFLFKDGNIYYCLDPRKEHNLRGSGEFDKSVSIGYQCIKKTKKPFKLKDKVKCKIFGKSGVIIEVNEKERDNPIKVKFKVGEHDFIRYYTWDARISIFAKPTLNHI